MLLIRCDAGPRHGLGHLMRCLNIAVHARKKGLAVQFVCQAPDEILQRIHKTGFDVTPQKHSTGSDDPAVWLHEDVVFVLVDSKEIDAEYVCRIASHANVICFDDEVARDLPCRAVINNNIWARASAYSAHNMRELWIGPKYNTIDSGYFSIAADRREGLLVTMGGEDPHDHTSWLVRTLRDQIVDLPVHVCIGPAHPTPDRVIALCHEALPDAVIYKSPSSLIEAASHCALALTAGGTTCYELASSGFAMAVVALEDHQLIMRDALVGKGAALSLGSYADREVGKVCKVMNQLRKPEVVEGLIQSANALFNAPGSANIVEAIKGLQRSK